MPCSEKTSPTGPILTRELVYWVSDKVTISRDDTELMSVPPPLTRPTFAHVHLPDKDAKGLKIKSYNRMLLVALVAAAVPGFLREAVYYVHLLDSGELKSAADSISIPIGQAILGSAFLVTALLIFRWMFRLAFLRRAEFITNYFAEARKSPHLEPKVVSLISAFPVILFIAFGIFLTFLDYQDYGNFWFDLIFLVTGSCYLFLLINYILNGLCRKAFTSIRSSRQTPPLHGSNGS